MEELRRIVRGSLFLSECGVGRAGFARFVPSEEGVSDDFVGVWLCDDEDLGGLDP